MPLEDLELEFEDEDEAKTKKDAIHVDVDLVFSSEESPGTIRPTPQKITDQPVAEVAKVAPKKPAPGGSQPTIQRPQPQASGTNPRVNQARPTVQPAEGAKVTHLPQRPAAVANSNRVQGSLALADQVFTEDVHEELVELREKVHRLEVESQVKVGIAEFKAEFMSDILSDMKLLDHQVTQILTKLNAKHPDSRNEVLMIKKLLNEFVASKKKK